VASGIAPSPAARRARATASAVCRAVPDGASTLSGWCSSTTSTDSKHRAEREVRGHQHADAGVRGEVRLDPAQRLRRPPGGADDRVHALGDQGPHVRLRRGRDREVHGHARARGGDPADVVAVVEHRDQVQVGRRLDGRHDRPAHAPGRAQHGHGSLLAAR
jgi:hypothetical protein